MKKININQNLKIGLALGSGSSRGWAHIGVINALADIGIYPNIICGTSVGALIGASYVSNRIDKLEKWACSFTKIKTAKYFKLNKSMNGLVNTARFHKFLDEYVVKDEALIEDFSKIYASVSTELESGKEVWLQKGKMIEAVWASIALPGLFPSIKINDKWHIDGALVNPVPVSVCRALGADIIIAVDLNSDIVGKSKRKKIKKSVKNESVTDKISHFVKDSAGLVLSNLNISNETPSSFEAISSSVNIVHNNITRIRLALDPPDIILTPKLSHIGLLDFHRAKEAINEGKRCVKRMLPEINYIFEKEE